MLKRGSNGTDVHALQYRLVQLGHAIKVDGKFGPLTEAAVYEFQLDRRLNPDGIAGPITLAAIDDRVLELAGRRAIVKADELWMRDVYDPPRTDKSAEAIASKNIIGDMIHTGLGWTWEPAYAGDGDFEWCGAFAATCWPTVKPLLRRAYFASTYRLDRFARYQPVNGEINAGKGRLLAELDAGSMSLPWQPRAGDILLVGKGSPSYGSHICLVESYASGVFQTLEGNGNGRGPHGERQHGVVRAQRKLGGPGWHARRLIRPSIEDLA